MLRQGSDRDMAAYSYYFIPVYNPDGYEFTFTVAGCGGFGWVGFGLDWVGLGGFGWVGFGLDWVGLGEFGWVWVGLGGFGWVWVGLMGLVDLGGFGGFERILGGFGR